MSDEIPPFADPFATDLFMAAGAPGSRAAPGRNRRGAGSLDGVAWHSQLKQVTHEQARISSTLANLPTALSVKTAARALAVYTQTEAERVSVALADLREAPFASAVAQQADGLMFASFLAEPQGSPLALAIDRSFAQALIDRALGGQGAMPDKQRALSLAEAAVMEFLCLMLVREFNQELGETLLRLERLSPDVPSWLAAKLAAKKATVESDNGPSLYGFIATFRVSVDTSAGFVRLYAPSDALGSFGAQGILKKASKARSMKKIRQFAAIAPEISATLIIGSSEVATGDLAQLECGDVAIIEQPYINWAGGRISGKLRLRLGDGGETIIGGRVVQAAPADYDSSPSQSEHSGNSSMTIELEVETISGGGSMRLTERFNMEDTIKDEEATGEGAAVLDGLLLTAHVELAAQRIRLDELAQLRTGQIINLGCKPTDPVDLVVDGRRIARGELVDIEGSLGVRITQVAG